jgi:hypothetical protein
MPFAAPYSRSGSNHFNHQQKTYPSLRNGLKTRLCKRFISSDCQNTAYLGLFLNGGRYGLLFDLKMSDQRPYWARIGVSLYYARTQDMMGKASLSPRRPLKKTDKYFPAFSGKCPAQLLNIFKKHL